MIDTATKILTKAQETIAEQSRQIEYWKDEDRRHIATLSEERRLFMDLYQDYRTLKLRFGWLEEAARDVVLACPQHLPERIVKLADELGIEIPNED